MGCIGLTAIFIFLCFPIIISQADDVTYVDRTTWRVDEELETIPFLDKECDFPKLDGALIKSWEDLLPDFHGIPFVLYNCTNGWPAVENWQRPNFLSLYGDYGVVTGSEASIVYSGGQAEEPMMLKDLVGSMNPNDSARFVFDTEILRRIPQLKQDVHIPSIFNDWDSIELETQGKMWHMLSLGPSRSGLPFHNHGKTWLAVVHGMKKWFVYPLGYNSPTSLQTDFDPSKSVFDWFIQEFPLLLNYPKPSLKDVQEHRPLDMTMNSDGYRPFECLQKPGEVLFLPSQWSHLTMNVGDTIAYGGQQSLADDERITNAQSAYRINPSDYTALKDIGLSLFNQANVKLNERRSNIAVLPSGLMEITDPHELRQYVLETQDSWVAFLPRVSYELVAYEPLEEHVSLEYLQNLTHQILRQSEINVAIVLDSADLGGLCFDPHDFHVDVKLFKGASGKNHSVTIDKEEEESFDGPLFSLVNYVQHWIADNELLRGQVAYVSNDAKLQYREALNYFRKALAQKPLHPETLTMLCEAAGLADDHETMIHALESAESAYDHASSGPLNLPLTLASLYHKLASIYLTVSEHDKRVLCFFTYFVISYVCIYAYIWYTLC